jgi:hypothetical protein
MLLAPRRAWGAWLVIALAGCMPSAAPPPAAAPPSPPGLAPQDDAGALFMPDLMAFLVDPAAGVLLAAAGSETSRDAEPRAIEAWQAVVDAAVQLAQTGRTLTMPALAMGRDDWLQWSVALRDGAAACGTAATQRDARGLVAAGAQVRAACQSCHARYASDLVEPAAPPSSR